LWVRAVRKYDQKDFLIKRAWKTFAYDRSVHYQHLVDAYFAMDVFAFASLSRNAGIVLIEAMARRSPGGRA